MARSPRSICTACWCTGAGKSTLLSLLKPEIAPTGECTGELRVLGENVADMDVRASAERVGYVFQDPENQIVCETVWHEMAFGLENLGMSRDEMRRRVAETSYFFGMEDWLHRDTDTLSGGRKQLLSLAAVLALRPRVLLLDEPLSALDAKVRVQLRDQIRRIQLTTGTTTVFVTHDQEEALAVADRIGVMNKGKIEQIAAPQDLYQRPPPSTWPRSLDSPTVCPAPPTARRRWSSASAYRCSPVPPKGIPWPCSCARRI